MRLRLLSSILAALVLAACGEPDEPSTVQPGFVADALACLPGHTPVISSTRAPLAGGAVQAAGDEGPGERYIVHFEDEADEEVIRAAGGRTRKKLRKRAVMAELKKGGLSKLRMHPRVRRIEPDAVRVPLAQTVPWGVTATGAPKLWLPGAGAGVRTCVIDSGLHIGHEDLQLPNVQGVPSDWSDDSCGHGTHVAGTLAALQNDVGVLGIDPGLDLVVVKVFSGENCRWSYASELVAALDECRKAGAKVVNMSLGGGAPTELEREAFEQAWRDGILVVAASGNDGSTEMLYPASYPTVLSVGAVDADNEVPSFSQRNGQVDLVAPGVDIRSTVPYKPVHEVRAGDAVFDANVLNGSPRTSGTTGLLRDGGTCDQPGDWKDAVVLCKRGGDTFQEKVANVTAAGGVAAVIYNNSRSGFSGTLGRSGATIPALSISGKDGAALLAKTGTQVTVVSQRVTPASGYSSWSGTSMAAPHVAGLAASIWGQQPQASNAQVRAALERSALDIGPPGRDDLSGHGVVRGREALQLLEQRSFGNLEPYAGFSVLCRGLTCTFSSTSVDPDGEIASTVFRFGEVIATGTSVTHAFPAPGTYPVEIEVTDSDGATDRVSGNVEVCVPR